jgi:hypothetical protein
LLFIQQVAAIESDSKIKLKKKIKKKNNALAESPPIESRKKTIESRKKEETPLSPEPSDCAAKWRTIY